MPSRSATLKGRTPSGRSSLDTSVLNPFAALSVVVVDDDPSSSPPLRTRTPPTTATTATIATSGPQRRSWRRPPSAAPSLLDNIGSPLRTCGPRPADPAGSYWTGAPGPPTHVRTEAR